MATNQVTRMISSEEQLSSSWAWLHEMITRGLKGGAVKITLGRQKRTLEQNDKLWAMLSDVSRQCSLLINGEWQKGSPEDWKTVFTAALNNETRMCQGINGGVVMLGRSTSRMNKAELSDLIELIYSYGAENNVNWSE